MDTCLLLSDYHLELDYPELAISHGRVTEHELKGAWGVAGTLAEPAPTGDAFILGELKQGVEEAVHHLLDNVGLDLIVEGVNGEVGGGAHDVEGSVEVIGSMEDNSAGVYQG